MNTPIAILTPEQIAEIAREAYEAGRSSAMPEKAWTAQDVADFLGVHKGTVYTLAANMEIPCRKIGDRYIFSPAAIARWVEEKE